MTFLVPVTCFVQTEYEVSDQSTWRTVSFLTQIMGRGILLRLQRRKEIDSERGEAGLWEMSAVEKCLMVIGH